MNPDELNEALEQGYDIPVELIDSLLNRDARSVALMAVALGWNISKTSGGIHLVAEDNTSIQLPKNSGLNFKVFRSRVRTVCRHGVIRIRIPLLEWVTQVIRITKIDQSHAQVMREAVNTITSEQHWQNVGGGTLDDGGGNVRVMTTGDGEVIPVLSGDALHITREEPWSAHGRVRSGGSETYPSDAVMERQWSDGHTDYACRWPDCDYVNDKARSTAAHYGAHLRGQGKSQAPEADGLDEAWVPRQTARITRLRRELDGALIAALAAGLDLRNPEFTQFVAQWIIDHRIEKAGTTTDDGEDEGPLSLEQIVDKISALADRGRSRVLREQIDTLNALLDESEGARRKAEGNLHALRDMLNEE
jgi:hypothetical protein